MELLIATHNNGKVAELKELLSGLPVEILSLDDADKRFGPLVMPEETGSTYEANATLKAEEIAKITSLPTLADDSGLEVMALGGRPGVHSARYVKGSDHDRVVALLKEMEGKENRSAKFVSVIALHNPRENHTYLFRGEVAGTLMTEPRGSHGFGYDPIFVPNGYSETMAELGAETKNEISHRAVAMKKFADWWRKTVDS
jgi:XTP/dITP diphosphohydrolase